MGKIIRKVADQPQDSVHLWDWEGNNGFNCIYILCFNTYLKQFGQTNIKKKTYCSNMQSCR